jgi:flavin-binding protein dodecin
VAVARLSEVIVSSPEGFREAVDAGLARLARAVPDITGVEVLAKRVKVEQGRIVEYRVEMKVLSLLEK